MSNDQTAILIHLANNCRSEYIGDFRIKFLFQQNIFFILMNYQKLNAVPLLTHFCEYRLNR